MVIEKTLNYRIATEDNNTENFTTQTIKLKVSENKGMYIVHRALIQQLHNKRQRTASSKTRSEVRGGGRKPWKQKGTGKARAGSTRSPLWKGGGVIFGPKAKHSKKKINSKEKNLALRTILYNKFNNTFVINNLFENLEKPKTKFILENLNNLGINFQKAIRVLIIIDNNNKNFYLSIRNLKNIELINADQINILALLKADKLIITTNALTTINRIHNAKNK